MHLLALKIFPLCLLSPSVGTLARRQETLTVHKKDAAIPIHLTLWRMDEQWYHSCKFEAYKCHSKNAIDEESNENHLTISTSLSGISLLSIAGKILGCACTAHQLSCRHHTSRQAVWLLNGKIHLGHDICGPSHAGKVQGTTQASVHCICRPNKSIRHHQS